MTALWLTALVVALFTGLTLGFLAASVLATGANEDRCLSCQRDAILRAYRLADGEEEWRDGTDD